MLEWTEYTKILTALIAIVNPIGAIPIYVGLTQGHPNLDRKKTVRVIVITVITVLSIVMVCGEPLLSFFGISLGSFRVGGGILILLMAISMMHGKHPRSKQTPEESEEADVKSTIAVVPMGIPLLAGPGSISSVILYSHKSTSIRHYLILFAIILTVGLVISFTLNMAPRIAGWLGKTGINIITRIMGLILAAIGIEFIADGLMTLFPSLL